MITHTFASPIPSTHVPLRQILELLLRHHNTLELTRHYYRPDAILHILVGLRNYVSGICIPKTQRNKRLVHRLHPHLDLILSHFCFNDTITKRSPRYCDQSPEMSGSKCLSIGLTHSRLVADLVSHRSNKKQNPGV